MVNSNWLRYPFLKITLGKCEVFNPCQNWLSMPLNIGWKREKICLYGKEMDLRSIIILNTRNALAYHSHLLFLRYVINISV